MLGRQCTVLLVELWAERNNCRTKRLRLIHLVPATCNVQKILHVYILFINISYREQAFIMQFVCATRINSQRKPNGSVCSHLFTLPSVWCSRQALSIGQDGMDNQFYPGLESNGSYWLHRVSTGNCKNIKVGNKHASCNEWSLPTANNVDTVG